MSILNSLTLIKNENFKDENIEKISENLIYLNLTNNKQITMKNIFFPKLIKLKLGY